MSTYRGLKCRTFPFRGRIVIATHLILAIAVLNNLSALIIFAKEKSMLYSLSFRPSSQRPTALFLLQMWPWTTAVNCRSFSHICENRIRSMFCSHIVVIIVPTASLILEHSNTYQTPIWDMLNSIVCQNNILVVNHHIWEITIYRGGEK